MGFAGKLADAAAKSRSWLCVGLDPEPAKLPEAVRRESDPIFAFNKAIIDATKDLVCCYKPQSAFYEAEGPAGLEALRRTHDYIRTACPGVPILLDVKRCDVPNTARLYAKAAYGVWKADAVTVVCYMGFDGLAPFCEGDGYAIVVVRSSNPGAKDLQDLQVSGSEPLYVALARKIAALPYRNVGAVVGATYPQELEAVRTILPDRVLLVPGVGAQGGDLERSVRGGADAKGGNVVIASSRSVLYASPGADFADAARKEAERLRAAIENARPAR